MGIKIKVFIVEDDQSMGDLIELSLKINGFDVVCESMDSEYLQKLRDASPDVIIMDSNTSLPSDWNTCTTIRKVNRSPILVLSALDHPGEVVKALDAGADDFLTKPVSISVLVSRVNMLARRKPPKQTDTLRRSASISL